MQDIEKEKIEKEIKWLGNKKCSARDLKVKEEKVKWKLKKRKTKRKKR